MKPATRFLLLGTSLIVLLAALAAAAVVWQTQRTVQREALQRVQRVASVYQDLQDSRLRELQLRAEVLSNDVAFVDYVAQSLIPNAQLGGAVDSASISDLLNERRRGYDIAAVLDPSGKLVATSGILLRDTSSIQDDPLVNSAIRSRKPVQGAWVSHGELLWVAINPLLRGGALQGVLVTATHVNPAFVADVSRLTHAAVSFAIQPSAGSPPAPSSPDVSGWMLEAIQQQLPHLLAHKTDQAFSLNYGGHQASAWLTPLTATGGRAALIAADASDNNAATINAGMMPSLLGIAASAVLAWLLVMLQWRRTWLPLQHMLDILQRAAEAGDRRIMLRVGGSAIVQQLSERVNGLVTSSGAGREGASTPQKSAN